MPTIFKKKIFTKIQYRKFIRGSDDTLISRDLIKKKFKLGMLNIVCNEVNNNSFFDIYTKFLLYGNADYYYYILFKNKRSIFITLYHPLRHFLKLFILITKSRKFKFIFFIIIITMIRYLGFFRLFIK